MVSGPARAATRCAPSAADHGWSSLPRLLSVTLTLSLATFFTQFVHPLAEPWTIMQTPTYPTVPLPVRQELGAASLLLSTILLMGSLFLLLRADRGLPRGGVTVLVGLNALAMSVFQDQYHLLPGIVVAAVLADGLVAWLRPSRARLAAVRIVAVVIPLLLVGGYLAMVMLQEQLLWSVHLWVGSLVLASLAGWAMSHAMLPTGHERAAVATAYPVDQAA
jgi:hypothetical protein